MMENIENVTRLDEEDMETVSGGVKLREDDRKGTSANPLKASGSAPKKHCDTCNADVEYNEFTGGRCFCKSCGNPVY